MQINDLPRVKSEPFLEGVRNYWAETFPPPTGDGGDYFPVSMASDNQNVPTSHMAVALQKNYDYPCGPSLPPVLASYTNDYYGNLFYNGAKLKPAVYPESMVINPGNLLAVSGADYDESMKEVPGLQVFHFNGRNPITGYSNILQIGRVRCPRPCRQHPCRPRRVSQPRGSAKWSGRSSAKTPLSG